MMNMYMDESGSVHPKKNGLNQFFVIGIMMSRHEKQLRRAYKIFIRKNLETLNSLEDYLNQEMVLNAEFVDSVQVKYYDSAQNPLIQIADVFSNIMYSNLMTRGAYQKELKELSQKEYILPLFFFPPK